MIATKTFWMDCPIHGTKEYPSAGNFCDKTAYCFDCKDFTGTARIITISNGKDSYREECDNRCLNGKKSCGCRCKGSCHGMSTCNPDLHPKG